MVAFYSKSLFQRNLELLGKAICRRKCHDFPALLHECSTLGCHYGVTPFLPGLHPTNNGEDTERSHNTPK